MYKSEQLAQHLKLSIENGTWSAQSKLPSLREQAEISGFSLMTVMNAYQDLEAQGFIYSRENQVILLLNSQKPSSSSNNPRFTKS